MPQSSSDWEALKAPDLLPINWFVLLLIWSLFGNICHWCPISTDRIRALRWLRWAGDAPSSDSVFVCCIFPYCCTVRNTWRQHAKNYILGWIYVSIKLSRWCSACTCPSGRHWNLTSCMGAVWIITFSLKRRDKLCPHTVGGNLCSSFMSLSVFFHWIGACLPCQW